ncbi:Sapep family Mn(2+)-dependent dipeptidase [Olsenella profusa]|uniref:Sapep family Mn(2+)-dependent dipeptidase n=1 Tax=Olsenella profusa TaxID=138595 RepID=A0ABS2F292_9ACTN|nr:Sapep family Mn(2+)-dependent dipeptidase [Olsenella profusa]MBM6775104.1 Sapep family Mn(2+)-dependent dipeptidase [Olsenella profusa]
MVDEQFKHEVDAYVDEVWEDVVADIARLVRHESVEDLSAAELGKPWGPASNAALVEAEDMAARLSLEVTDVEGYLGFADVPGASGPDRYIATIAHTDIVPLGLGWHFPPLEVTRKDGYLVGRGVQDDKGPFVVSLYAAHFFARRASAGLELPYTLRCIIGNNEETGMGDVPRYLGRYPEPLFCFSPDADFPLICGEKGLYSGRFTSGVVAGEKIVELDGGTSSNAIPGNAVAVVRADAGSLPAAERIAVEGAGEGLARVTATGVGGHASMPAGTVNAIGVLARYLLANDLAGAGERTFLELLARLTEDTDGTATGIAASDDKFGALTCIAGTVRTVDGRFVQTVDSRFPTTTSAEAITERLSSVAAEYGCAFEQTSGEEPFYISPDSPEIRVLLSTYEEYAGRPAKAFTIGGGTYARHFKRACAFGPHDPSEKTPDWVGMEHGPDEAVSEESLRRALKIYIVSIARLMELDL